MAIGIDVREQPLQKPQAALHAFVACFQHLERLLETNGRGIEPR